MPIWLGVSQWWALAMTEYVVKEIGHQWIDRVAILAEPDLRKVVVRWSMPQAPAFRHRFASDNVGRKLTTYLHNKTTMPRLIPLSPLITASDAVQHQRDKPLARVRWLQDTPEGDLSGVRGLSRIVRRSRAGPVMLDLQQLGSKMVADRFGYVPSSKP